MHRHDVKPLLAFQQDYPQARVALLYRGAERLRLDGVLCLPCAEFLRQLLPGRDPLPDSEHAPAVSIPEIDAPRS